MRIATWNVNSVRARLPRVLEWLERQKPDVVCLQETKCQDEAFPREPIEDAGYQIACFGQKTYNGVAILARKRIEDVACGMQDGVEDTEPHAQGQFPAIVREAGLKTLTETSRTHTPTGQITTWIARR